MFSATRLVIVTSFLIQLVGFSKLLLIAHIFGASAALDGYYLALIVPTLFIGLINGLLQTGFIPVYVELVSRSRDVEADRLVSSMLTLLVLILLPICLAMSIGAGWLIEHLVLSTDPDVLAAASHSMQIVIFVLLLNSLADFLALTMTAHKRFLLASLSPLASVLISVVILVHWQSAGQDALNYGLLLGVAAQLLILLTGVIRQGLQIRPVVPRLSEQLKRVISLVSLIALGVIFGSLNGAVDQVMASMLGEGAVSIIGYANRFHSLPVQLLIMGVGTVLLPHLTSMVLDRETASIHTLFRGLLLALTFISCTLIVLILVAADPILTLLLSGEGLDSAQVRSIARIWLWYTVGILPMAWGIFLARYFQASSQPAIITKFAILSFVANIGLNLMLIGPLGLEGLAISTSVVYLLTGVALHIRFVRENQLNFQDVYGRIVPVLIFLLGTIALLMLFHSRINLVTEVCIAMVLIGGAGLTLRTIPEFRVLWNKYG